MKEFNTNNLKNLNAFNYNFKNITLYFYIDNKTIFVYKEELKKDFSNRGNYIQAGSKAYIDGWLYGAVQCKYKMFDN